MLLTVKENGVRVANSSFIGTRVNADQIRNSYENLLGELGFVFELKRKDQSLVYVHQSTSPMSPSSLCVVWMQGKGETFVLRVLRGEFFMDHKINLEGYEMYGFVSEILQSVRDVWVGGTK